MYDEIFKEVDLEVVELPLEIIENQPHYAAFLRQLPFIAVEGATRQEVFRKLAVAYDQYREEHLPKEQEDEAEEKQLTLAELLRYYDGETIDGFSDYFKS